MRKHHLCPLRVAFALGVHPRNVWLWQREGKIPAAYVTPGGHHRYDPVSVGRALGVDLLAAPSPPCVLCRLRRWWR